MYGCESWIIKKAERWRTDAFELCYWRRLLRVPWTARRSNYSIHRKSVLNIHWKDCCWSWKSNTLATWCEELTHWKSPWCRERLKAGAKGKTEDEMVGWYHWLYGHEFEQALGVGDGQGSLAWSSPWGHKQSDMTEQLNWTDMYMYSDSFCFRVETNTTLRSNYTPIEINFKKLCLYYETSIKIRRIGFRQLLHLWTLAGVGRVVHLERAWKPYSLSPNLALCITSIWLFLAYILFLETSSLVSKMFL